MLNKFKLFLLFVIALFIVSCSSQGTQKEETQDVKKSNKNLADEYFLNGSLAEMKGDINQAVVEYSKALEIDPSAGIHYALAKNYLALKKTIQALKNSRAAVELDPSKKDYLFLLGSVYRILNQTDSAATVYERIVKLDSNDVTALFSLADLIEAKKPLQALEIYNKIMSKTGPEWSILVKVTDISERLGRVDETLTSLEKLRSLNPESDDLLKILIQAYLKNKKLDKGEKLLNEALITTPDDPDLIEYKAKLFVEKNDWISGAKEYKKILTSKDVQFEGKFAIASAFLNKAVEDSTLRGEVKNMFEILNKDTSNWQVKYVLGGLYADAKNDTAALRLYKEAVELASWNAELWVRYGGLLFDKGKYEEAVNELSKISENFTNDYLINFILGLAYSQKNDYNNGEKYLTKAVNIKKDEVGALSALGFCLDKLNKDEEAIKYLNEALKIDSVNIQALSNLALIHENNKNYTKSDSLYTLAIKIDSTEVLLLNNYAYSLAERNIRLDEAYKMVKKAYDKEPENSSYLDTMGWIYFRMGKYKEAEKLIKKAIDKDSKSATLYDHLGDIYFKMNKKDKAKTYWQKALEIEPENIQIKTKLEKGEL